MVEVNKPVQESEEEGGGEESSTTVSVLSYNLLAQDLIRKNRYLYSDAVPELLEWDFRKTNLLKDLTDSGADVRGSLCMGGFPSTRVCGDSPALVVLKYRYHFDRFVVDLQWPVWCGLEQASYGVYICTMLRNTRVFLHAVLSADNLLRAILKYVRVTIGRWKVESVDFN